MTHVFFTSYARLDSNKFSKLDRVVEELRERVRSKLGAKAAQDVGFFDTQDIQTGADWERVLGTALRHARILVCMCSPTYFNSEFCAKEFEVFRRRLQDAADAFKDVRVILPVLWDVGLNGM